MGRSPAYMLLTARRMTPRMWSTTARLPHPTPLTMKHLREGSPTSRTSTTMTMTPTPPTPEPRLKGVRLTLPLSDFWPNGMMRVAAQTLVILMQLLAPDLRRCPPSDLGRPVPPPLLPRPPRPLRLLPRANRLRLPPLGNRLVRRLSAGPEVDPSRAMLP